jgi:uncharacterized membrane protein
MDKELQSASGNVAPWQRFYYYFLFCSFMGYIYENLLDIIWYHHLWQWQGPLHGPWLVIYGFGGVILLALLERLVEKKARVGPVNIMPILVAILILLLVGVIEYFAHWLLDSFFDFRPWDYTAKPFNINGRVCLEDSVRFVVLGIVQLYVCMPWIDRFLHRLTERQNRLFFGVLAGIFIVDIIFSTIVMLI